jgi:DNA polymerase-3 subunit epsilon
VAERNRDQDPGSLLCVIDLEMSGPNAQVHEILDVGLVMASVEAAFPEQSSWGSRVKPLRIGNADRGALKVVGYDSRRWRDATPLAKALAEVHRLGRGATLAGWGLESDVAFLRYTFTHLGLDWPFATHVVDIQDVARTHLAGKGLVDRFNLGHVADRLGLGRLGEHSALADAYATYDVLVALWKHVNRA